MIRRLLWAIMMVAAMTLLGSPAASSAAGATAQCSSADGVKVSAAESPATVPVATATGETVEVVVTITGSSFEITEPAGASYALSSASWCVKSSTKITEAAPGTGLTGSSPSQNKKGVPQGIGYVIVYDVTAALAAPCYEGADLPDVRYPDIRLTGAIGTLDNLSAYETDDGSCGGQVVELVSVVAAPNESDALSACVVLDANNNGALRLSTFYLDAPPDWWGCAFIGK